MATTEADAVEQVSSRAPWCLDPRIGFLNHGSYGACPAPVLAVQQQLRERLEADPVDFFQRRYEGLLDEARESLARFVGTRPEQLVFVGNATAGANAVLASLSLEAGDEIVVTNHGYNAVVNAAREVLRRAGGVLRVAKVPFPLDSTDEVVEAVLAEVGPRTRLVVLDHITSPTALIFPVLRIAVELRARGVDLLVDGAHAPGMVPLDLEALDVPYYTGNCHKWLCAPKGAAFLRVAAERQAQVRPPVISHGANSARTDRSRFQLEFDWTGTHDPTAWLSVPAALECLGGLRPGGWPALMEENHQKALAARRLLCETLGLPAPAPEQMIGSMAAIPLLPLPDAVAGDPTVQPASLQAALWQAHDIEVPVAQWPHPPGRVLRVSAQAYNRPEDYQRLADVLPNLLKEEPA